MIKEMDLVRIKILGKWVYDIVNEIANNKNLTEEDIMTLLHSLKDTISDLNMEIVIIIRENLQNKK